MNKWHYFELGTFRKTKMTTGTIRKTNSAIDIIFSCSYSRHENLYKMRVYHVHCGFLCKRKLGEFHKRDFVNTAGLKLAIPVISLPVTKLLMSYVPSYEKIGSKSQNACRDKDCYGQLLSSWKVETRITWFTRCNESIINKQVVENL